MTSELAKGKMGLFSMLSHCWQALKAPFIAINRAGNNHYALIGRDVVRTQYGRRQDSIGLDEIVSWQIVMEMGFDIVLMNFRDEQTGCWLDDENDLIAILRSELPHLELPEVIPNGNRY